MLGSGHKRESANFLTQVRPFRPKSYIIGSQRRDLVFLYNVPDALPILFPGPIGQHIAQVEIKEV